MNPYLNYYVNQAGNGYAPYSGVRYQRGNGFLGRWFGKALSAVLPAIKYIGKKGLKTVFDIGTDLAKGEDIKVATKRRLKEVTKDIANEGAEKINEVIDQTGRGIKRKNKTTKNKKTKKIRKSKSKKNKIRKSKKSINKSKKRRKKKKESVNFDIF